MVSEHRFWWLQNLLSPFYFSSTAMSAENSKDALMDISNSYYVHHSDQPGHLLVPNKLNDSNYRTWSKSMTHAIFLIKKAIVTITQGTMSVLSYYIKIKSLWDELDAYRSFSPCNQIKAHNFLWVSMTPIKVTGLIFWWCLPCLTCQPECLSRPQLPRFNRLLFSTGIFINHIGRDTTTIVDD